MTLASMVRPVGGGDLRDADIARLRARTVERIREGANLPRAASRGAVGRKLMGASDAAQCAALLESVVATLRNQELERKIRDEIWKQLAIKVLARQIEADLRAKAGR